MPLLEDAKSEQDISLQNVFFEKMFFIHICADDIIKYGIGYVQTIVKFWI